MAKELLRHIEREDASEDALAVSCHVLYELEEDQRQMNGRRSDR